MSSFINTMFVHSSPPQPYSQSPKPLPALHSNVLAESESYIHIQPPASPQETYKSPLQRHLHNVISDSPGSQFGSNIPVPVHVENRTHDVHRGYRGLGNGLKDIARQADLLTPSNANARTRNQAFQPQKRAKGTNSYQLKQFAEATLGGNSLRKVVQLPEGEDRDEWLAVNSTMLLESFTQGPC
jgi:MOB kinase activator 1